MEETAWDSTDVRWGWSTDPISRRGTLLVLEGQIAGRTLSPWQKWNPGPGAYPEQGNREGNGAGAGLEHKSVQKQLRELGALSLEKRSLR